MACKLNDFLATWSEPLVFKTLDNIIYLWWWGMESVWAEEEEEVKLKIFFQIPGQNSLVDFLVLFIYSLFNIVL